MEQDTKKCPYCGEVIKSTAKKCRFCGEWLDGSAQQVSNSTKGHGKNDSILKYALIGVAVIAIIVIAVVLISKSDDSGVKEETSMSDTIPPADHPYSIDEVEKKIAEYDANETPEERANPDIIKGNRKKRICAGSGTTVQDINQLLKQFFAARDMMKRMAKGKRPNFPF